MDNHLLLTWLTEMHEPDFQQAFFKSDIVLNLGFINATSPGYEFPDDIGGVGLARKIGMDSALLLFSPDVSHKTLVCLDADCTVEANYVSTIRTAVQTRNIKAGVVQYEHNVAETSPEFKDAILCYELFLRHYTLGLIYARSPFAFHSIGSAMFCDVETYLKCEGMNKKKAGEDFYFLEKIAKQKDIFTLNGTRVYPSSRPSWRVPFGTGQRVNRFLGNEQDEYLVYNPASFEILKLWLPLMQNRFLEYEELFKEAESINPALAKFLVSQHFDNFWEKAHKLPEKQFHAQTRFWFDGFRTLKLLHFLRDNGFPLEPMFHAVPELLDMITMRTTDANKKVVTGVPSRPIKADTRVSASVNGAVPSFDEQLELLERVRSVSRSFAPNKID